MLNVVFVGASAFGLRCLHQVAQTPGVRLTGIVTNPPRFEISYAPGGVTNVLHQDFAPFAQAHNIPLFTMTTKMTDPALLAFVRQAQPHYVLVVGWYHMVPKALRELAPCLGMHASLLPDYSGGAPLVWAMINGETQTGITLFQMDSGVDSGPIVGQRRVAIEPKDTIATLYARIETAGLQLLAEQLPCLCDGTATFKPQSETGRRVFPQRTPADGRIDWQWPATQIERFIRAQTKPYPGAFTEVDGQKITLWQARIETHQPEPDQALLAFSCADGWIVPTEYEMTH